MLGNSVSRTLISRVALMRNGVSRTCVPKRSLGTRRWLLRRFLAVADHDSVSDLVDADNLREVEGPLALLCGLDVALELDFLVLDVHLEREFRQQLVRAQTILNPLLHGRLLLQADVELRAQVAGAILGVSGDLAANARKAFRVLAIAADADERQDDDRDGKRRRNRHRRAPLL